MKMNLKSIFTICALALVSVRAEDRSTCNRKCIKQNGFFIEARDDPSDNRYGCLLPKKNGDERSKYCVNYGNNDLCYEPSLGNINTCVYYNREFNGRGCAMSLYYLYNNIINDDKKYNLSKNTCYQKNGMFLVNDHDSTDHRFACLLPEKSGDSKTKYCVNYDNRDLCYQKDLGNLSYCILNDKNFHSRGCALSLGALYSTIKSDERKRDLSRATCIKRNGYYLENTQTPSDTRFSCLLPEKTGDSQTKHCVNYDSKDLCYEPDLGNMNYCVLNDPDYNSRGCALGLSALWYYKRH
ncbi:hypothetical protein BCR32DRAFT_286657 [Anaeromyces robustus]|uniref:Uncharacterized protein n=1 Tax=Anaeromyces robustus TaxID=1754192 RepID=A0A1Y1VV28_9FUNG|nr:hypothetical protein BCR32DRAFT_286657 [Anaeromyces robustus]|eukprot:ORX65142.1 hypothetical protein BCR32DRAFT_286657 [Anaeromyces robustus]